MKSTFVATSIAAVVLVSAAESAAYCRTRTCEFEQGGAGCRYDPVTRCSTVGTEAHWGETCLPYAIQKDGSIDDGISAAQLRQAVAEGFALWTSVPCMGGSPTFSVFNRGDIACDEVEYNCEAGDQNNNIIMFRDRDSPLEREKLALTTLTANLDTGEIFDADIEINSQYWDFAGDGENAADLARVINHELGHFLGLSHTVAPGALMLATYGGTFVPEDDDIAGICAIYEHSNREPACNVSRLTPDADCVGTVGVCRITVDGTDDGGGCACDVAGRPSRSGAWSAAALLALAGGLYRRRARCRQARCPQAQGRAAVGAA